MRKAALALLCVLASPAAAAAVAKPPVVVELFTAQGCASCGDANTNLIKMAERPGVLALTFPVDYWDYLGWPDTFAKPEFAERQKAYVSHLDVPEPYTPQVVVNGRAQAGGLQNEKIDKLVAEATRTAKPGPETAFIGERRFDVGSGAVPRGGGEVWLIRFDPREQDVVVKRGDNKGQTVPHINVVREVKRLGAWRGRPAAYRLPKADEDGLSTVVLVQDAHDGRVLAVAQPK
jgi:hypothetical protein